MAASMKAKSEYFCYSCMIFHKKELRPPIKKGSRLVCAEADRLIKTVGTTSVKKRP